MKNPDIMIDSAEPAMVDETSSPEAVMESAQAMVAAHTEVAEHAPEAWYQNPESWVAVSFLIFVVFAIKYIFPVLARGLDGRADKIRDQLEQASRLRAEAEALIATYKRQQEEKLQEAESIIAAAKRDAAALRVSAAEELNAAIERRSQQAQEKIARAEIDAVAHIRTQIIEMATTAARTSIAQQLQGQTDDPAIARALAAITRQIH